VKLSTEKDKIPSKLLVGFYITDICECECGNKVSPCEVNSNDKILYDDKREKVIGFECWICNTWISFPKTCQ